VTPSDSMATTVPEKTICELLKAPLMVGIPHLHATAVRDETNNAANRIEM
jgi:hypothetical protein